MSPARGSYRLLARLYVALILGLTLLASLSLLSGDLTGAACTVAVIAADFASPALLAVVVLGSVAIGAPLPAALGAVLVVLRLAGSLGTRLSRRNDPDALTRVAASLPEELHHRLREIAGDAPLTTVHLLRLAVDQEPATWAPLVRQGPADTYDGPLVDDGRGGQCSQFFAEAIGVAFRLRSANRPFTALLALGADIVPVSAASALTTDAQRLLDAAEVSPVELQEALAGFADSPGGAGVHLRIEALHRARAEHADVPREVIGEASSQDLAAASTIGWVASAAATVLLVAVLPWMVLRWLVRLPARVPGAMRRLGHAVRGLARSGRHATPRRRLAQLRRAVGDRLAPWESWPAAERLAWLVGRPAIGVAAVGTAAVLDGLVAAAATLVATFVIGRPLRSWPVALIAAAALSVLSPAPAVLATLRVGLTLAVRWRLGRARIVEARAAFGSRVVDLPAMRPDDARAAFFTAVQGADDDLMLERAVAYATAVWASGRSFELLALTRVCLRGLLLGQWPGSVGEVGLEGELRRMMVFEGGSAFVARWGSVAAAAGTAALIAPVSSPVGDSEPTMRVTAAIATTLIATPVTSRAPSLFGGIAMSLIVLLICDWNALSLVALAAAAGLIAPTLRTAFAVRLVAGRDRWRGWPTPRAARGRQRQHWKVANRTIDAGRIETGTELLRELAADLKTSSALAAAALGRVALLDVEQGRLGSAAATLDQLERRSLEPTSSSLVATGILEATLGDLADADATLRRALEMINSRSPLSPRATLALSDVLTRRGLADDALELLARHRSRPLAILGIDLQLDTEAAIAAAQIARGDLDSAQKRLEEATSISFAEVSGRPDDPGPDVQRRILRAEARLLLLQGQVALDQGDFAKAHNALKKAYGLVPAGSDRSLRATAQLLYGVASTYWSEASKGVALIRSGIAELEGQRTQLAVAARRTAMITAGELQYTRALRGLARASASGVREAGYVAAALIESLRQSSIAEALRDGSGRMGETAGELTKRIAALQRTTSLARDEAGDAEAEAELDHLLAQLGDEVSARFADAYAPRPVTPDQLRDVAARQGHLLAFYIPPSGLPGWRAWVSPSGTSHVDEVAAGDDPLTAELSELAPAGGFHGTTIHTPVSADHQRWGGLAELLLPPGLRAELTGATPDRPARLLVIPDGVLSLVPWAALTVAGEPLVRRAVIRVMPAATLATTPPSRERADAASGVVAHLAMGADETELQALRERGTDVHVETSRDEFTATLRTQRFTGAYLAMHGRETGLRQHIEFSDGSLLSAAVALDLPWPSWIVLASCLVGRMELRVGQEPLGLGISCMLGGADDVIASLVEITDDGAAQVCGELAARLADGAEPAAALRAVQLEQLDRSDWTTVADCLGLVCISASSGRHGDPPRATSTAAGRLRLTQMGP